MVLEDLEAEAEQKVIQAARELLPEIAYKAPEQMSPALGALRDALLSEKHLYSSGGPERLETWPKTT